MIAGELASFPNFGQANERSPEGFYRVRSEEIWPDIDPYLMTREQLDEQIKAGIRKYEKYFPPEGGGMGFGMFIAVVAVVAVAAVAVAAAGTASAAGGAGQAAATSAGAASASSTAAASNAIAGYATQAGAAGAGVASSAGAATAAGTTSAAAFGQQAFSMAQKAAPYAKTAATVARATGNKSEADQLTEAANIVEGSDSALDAAHKTYIREIEKRGMEMDAKAKKAARERLKKERGSYAAWLRRRAAKQQQHNPNVQTKGQSELIKWLPIATPFVLWGLTR